MPKSVNKPVRCVVLTTAFDILVTKEFWSPIAKSNKQTTISVYFNAIKLLNRPIEIKIKHSINMGIKYTFNRLFSLNFAIRKPEKKNQKEMKRYTENRQYLARTSN